MRNNGVVCSSSNCLPAGNVPSRSVLNVDSIVAHHPRQVSTTYVRRTEYVRSTCSVPLQYTLAAHRARRAKLPPSISTQLDGGKRVQAADNRRRVLPNVY